MRAYLFKVLAALTVLALVASAVFYLVYGNREGHLGRTVRVLSWLPNPKEHQGWAVEVGEQCGNAPFIMPTSGFIAYLWGDSFRLGHRHQGIDIFGGEGLSETPVIAAHAGYLTRLPDWRSTVIIRLPDDPINRGRQIWTYYTHMAGADGESFIVPEFPPGVSEVPVEAGELLGFQGNYSGNPSRPVGVHLHFSIVLDDGQGSFRNELEIANTEDPSPYLGLPLNAEVVGDIVPSCSPVPETAAR